MNKTNPGLRTAIVAVAVLCSTCLATAQPISSVGSTNLSQFLTEMQQYFGQIMQVSTAQLNQHMQPFVAGGNSATCQEPAPTVISETADQITFRWVGTPGDEYRVAYLNLLTGDRATTTINTIQHSFNVPDGLYLFAFQRICGGKKSNSVIIILDKVVALTEVPTLECDCVASQEYAGMEISGMSLAQFDEMDVLVRHTSNEENVVFRMHIQRSCVFCPTFQFNPYCDNYTISAINDVNYIDIEGATDNVLTFSGPAMNVEFDLPDLYEPVVVICDDAELGEDGTIRQLQIINNIPGTVYTIRGEKESSTPTQLSLYDQAGRQVWQMHVAAGSNYLEQGLNLSELPVGLYFLRIEDETGNQIQKLLRY